MSMCSPNPGVSPNIIRFLPSDTSLMSTRACSELLAHANIGSVFLFPVYIGSTYHVNVDSATRFECDDTGGSVQVGEWWFYMR